MSKGLTVVGKIYGALWKLEGSLTNDGNYQTVDYHIQLCIVLPKCIRLYI